MQAHTIHYFLAAVGWSNSLPYAYKSFVGCTFHDWPEGEDSSDFISAQA